MRTLPEPTRDLVQYFHQLADLQMRVKEVEMTGKLYYASTEFLSQTFSESRV